MNFIGSKDSPLFQCLLPYSAECHEALSTVLWLDFSRQDIEKEWRKREAQDRGVLSLRDVVAVFCAVPPASSANADWLFLYQKLSFLVQSQQRCGFHIFCLELSNDFEENRRQLVGFVRFGIAQDRKTADSNGAGSFYFFRSRIVYWSPQKIRADFHSKLARECLLRAKNLERDDPRFIPERILPWWNDFATAYAEEFANCRANFQQSIAQETFAYDFKGFLERFGNGRRDSRQGRVQDDGLTLLQQIIAPKARLIDILRSQNSHNHPDYFFLYARAPQSFSPLDEIVSELFALQPKFFKFLGAHGEKLFQVQPPDWQTTISEEIKKTLALNPLVSGNPAFTRYREAIDRLSSSCVALARLRGAPLRAGRTQVASDLRELAGLIRQIVSAEIDFARHDEQMTCRPNLYWWAYIEAYSQFVKPVLELRAQAWRARRFIFVLPSWVPAPFYGRSALIGTINQILLEIIRLLNCYQYCYLAMEFYRKRMTAVSEKIAAMRRKAPLLQEQQTNIIAELEESAASDWHFDLQNISADFQMMKPVDPSSGSPEALVSEALIKAGPHLDKIAGAIGEAAAESRSGKKIQIGSDEGIHIFTPNVFQKTEAWSAAESMLGQMASRSEFQESFDSLFETAGSREEKDELRIAFFPEQIDLPKNEKWLLWKKNALRKATAPLDFDACVWTAFEQPELSTKELADWLLAAGQAKGFWILELEEVSSGKIGMAAAIFPWLSSMAQRLFFQVSTGLNRQEFIKRCDLYARNALYPWIFWLLAEMVSSDDSVEDILQYGNNDLFDFIQSRFADCDRVNSCRDGKFEHAYFGRPATQSPYFYLKDCLNPVLMRLFEPRQGNYAPRFFDKHYLQAILTDDNYQLKSLVRLFYNFCIFNDQEVPSIAKTL